MRRVLHYCTYFTCCIRSRLEETQATPWIGAIDDLSVTTKRDGRTRKVDSRAKCNSGG
jgi:hypothetical protein